MTFEQRLAAARAEIAAIDQNASLGFKQAEIRRIVGTFGAALPSGKTAVFWELGDTQFFLKKCVSP